MPTVPILMPQLGESIAEATVVRIGIAPGDTVQTDQEVIEVETSKATMGVTTLCRGTVKEIMAREGETYSVGTLLGLLDVTDEELTRTGVESIEAAADRRTAEATSPQQQEKNLHFALDDDSYEESPAVVPSVKGLAVPTGTMGAHYISPRMRARMNDMGLREADISAIVGTGTGGRVTVEDLEKFLDYIETWPSSNASPMRMAVADAMRRSWTRPLATVGLPVKLDRVLEHRRNQDPKPGLTLYVLRAFALALVEEPATAGFLIGQKVVHPRAFDIGVAVQVDDGVVVPVLRKVDRKSLSELTTEYAEMVERGRRRRLSDDDLRGGIATVTNFGTFGLTSGTPIPLPNETLILGLGAGVKKPVWSDQVETFIPVTEAELVVTFDHRVVDGGGAGVLLGRVAQLLQEPEKL
ncbi:2-oxo acid dehydrogenase subunit E2 [Luteolibacter flavescens]|uniref:Dihydrolipoamide acetyltransferase component of pyruvate dehydrogenase complex n=1 Tax=Luteolibacter flavescens TaxID=1859460 RepID=A0ABT3FU58_9BACT|nr:dihydrolipoamide acetyltransferase family protein [Luteolibacter flavescens]MCW1886525.1 2-oxo acid dehydrogenase subunit E2 [Luteolibacter flavescens]